eukprot:GILI01003229.1.p1 GENE.GILI01003229.1~~GILI01003229.1.p1  ORF type:complete len:847 (+),score=272.04 GILI01003229.1:44-2584(+)
MRRLVVLVTLACAVAVADVTGQKAPISSDNTNANKKEASQSRTLSKSISLNEDLSPRIALNNTRPCHILRFIIGSRQLHTALEANKLSVVAIMSPHGSGDAENFINKTAMAARILEQQYRLGKIKFILTDPQAHMGSFTPQESVINALNANLVKKFKNSDVDSDALRMDHHSFQMDLNEGLHSRHRSQMEAGEVVNHNALPPRPFIEALHTHDYPAYVIAAGAEAKEIWSGRSLSAEDLASRVAAIAAAKTRVLTPIQVASFALRSPVDATVIVRPTAKSSQPLRVALAPFAQIIAADQELFTTGKVPRGSFLVLTRNSTVAGLPIPHASKLRSISDFFSTEAVIALNEVGYSLFEVDSNEGGKDSYTHTKALRRHGHSVSRSKSQSKSLSADEQEPAKVVDLVAPTINSDISLGMECLKVIARLVVPAINDFSHASMQAVYARAPCIVIAFHGPEVFTLAGSELTPELKRQCTYLYSDGGEQKLIASFGFELTEAGDEKKLLLGVHYDHGKYAYRTDMEEIKVPHKDPQDRERRKREREERKNRAARAAEAKSSHSKEEEDFEEDDDDSPYARPDDLEDDEVYQSKRKRPSNKVVKAPVAEEDNDDDEPEEPENDGRHREPPRPTYYVNRVAHRIAPFVKSVLSKKAQLYEKTQQFEGELTDPLASILGEFFYDFLDTDDIHERLLSDYTRDSFIVVFPHECKSPLCENGLRVMSTVAGNLDKYRETEAFRSMSLAFYNLTTNDLHKHMEPSLNNASGPTLVFIERMKKFDFFMHNHARYARARFNGGMAFEGHKEEGIIENETLNLETATTEDVYSFIKRHCRGAEHFLADDGKNLEEIEYDEL